MRTNRLVKLMGITALFLALGCSKATKKTDDGNENRIDGGAGDTGAVGEDTNRGGHLVVLRGVSELYDNGQIITGLTEIPWLAIVEGEASRRVDFVPDSDGEMAVAVHQDRFGVAYRCPDDDDLHVVYATLEELTEVNLLCTLPPLGAFKLCSFEAYLNWEGFDGDGVILSFEHFSLMSSVKRPETTAWFYLLEDGAPEWDLFVADTLDGVAERLYSRRIVSYECSNHPDVNIDLVADTDRYTEHPLIFGELIHPTDLIDDEEQEVTCMSQLPGLEHVHTCAGRRSSGRFALVEGATENYISIQGTWTGGRRAANAYLTGAPPATLELMLFSTPAFTESRSTGRIPDIGVTVTPDPDALKYELDIRGEDYASTEIIATKGWVAAGEPLATPALDGTDIDLSSFGSVQRYHLTAEWSTKGLVRLMNEYYTRQQDEIDSWITTDVELQTD